MWFTAHTWDARGKPNECEHSQSLRHGFQVNGGSVYTFTRGIRQQGPYAMAAGQSFTVNFEMDFDRLDNSADWSLVTWADQAGVTITHSEGIVSDHFHLQAERSD